MKKIFVSLFVCLLVLSLGVLLVKAETQTTVALTDGVQIRTDGNNGLRWEAKVTNPAEEGQVYGFVFAQGELTAKQLTVDTTGAVTKEVEGLKEDGTYHATMVKFPTSAAVQDITVRAYVKTGEEYTYSENVVVRNLSEVAVEAYKSGTTGDFVKAVYDASETTFNLNGGELVADYEYKVTRYDTDSNTGYYIGMSPSSHPSGATGLYWYRICFKYIKELDLYKIVAVRTSGESLGTVDYDYIMGAFESSATCTDKEAHKVFKDIINLGDDALNFYAQFDVPTKSSCDVQVKLFKDYGLFNNKEHYGGGETLPTAFKDYYDFLGWCAKENLSDEPVKLQGKDRVLYAKYTPTKYSITYNLNDGVCSKSLVNEYNIESKTIVLPTASEMTIENGKFGGWYDNSSFSGEPITEITSGSHGNIELYALWIMDAPTVLELTEADSAVLGQIIPTIIVSPNVKAGKYIANKVEYSTGLTAFATIDDALTVAKENDIIYVFAGTYDEALTISTANVTIIGPNYNIHGNSTRVDEAIITALTTINANNTTINGLKFTSNGDIKVGANNVLITNIYMAPSKTVACNGQNRQGCIVDSANISDLTVSNSYIAAPGSSNSYDSQFMSFNNVTNLVIKNNYICNPLQETISSSYAGMRIYNIKGTFEFSSNTVAWGTDGYVFNLANASGATNVNITDNIFKDNGLINQTATLAIQSCPATAKINIIGNEFYSFKGSTFTLNSDKGSTVNIKYNYYDANTNFKLITKGSAVISYESNCYMAALDSNTTVTDYGKITSKAALDYAYKVYKGETIEYTSKFYTNGYALGEGFTLNELPTSVDTTLNFHKGGYWETTDGVYVNHPYVLFYETSSSLTGFDWAYKVGLNYDEDLEMYYVNQVISNSNIALDATNLLSQYFLIINTSSCADGFTWAQTLSVGDYLSFSSDINSVSSTKGEGTALKASVYSDYEKYYYTVSTEKTITLPVLERFGYVFAGWYTSSDLSGEAITEYTYSGINVSCNFYAKWTKSTLTANMVMSNGVNSTTADHTVSEDGLTLTYAYVYVSGTNSFVVFQVYVDGVATSMANKWTVTYSNTPVLTSWADSSAMAAIKGAGTCVVTLTYKADPTITVSFTATLVDGSAV